MAKPLPSIELRPMNEADFAPWYEETLRDYAADKVRAGQWFEDEALARARGEMEKLLTQGVHTPDHHSRHIVDPALSHAVVGSLWWFERDTPGGRSGFIFNIEIKPKVRRCGYARAALKALEADTRERGFASLSLHVLAVNTGAVKLYESLGYQNTSFSMTLPLHWVEGAGVVETESRCHGQ